MVSRLSILSSFTVPTQHNAPYFALIQAPSQFSSLNCDWLTGALALCSLDPISLMMMSRGLSRGVGVSEGTMGHFTLESSHWRLARSHSGSFTVTLATASGQAGPGTRTGQTPSSQGHSPATGLAGLSLH